jgi:hypothetical protein
VLGVEGKSSTNLLGGDVVVARDPVKIVSDRFVVRHERLHRDTVLAQHVMRDTGVMWIGSNEAIDQSLSLLG